MPHWRDRRRAQSGATLVEVLVSLIIASLALALAVGTISTGLLNTRLAKRDTAIQAVMEYEMEQINAGAFSATALPYSDCFATESSSAPAAASAYLGACPSGYSIRADVSCGQTCSSSVQTWTIAISDWPSGSPTGHSVQLNKVTHQ